MIASSCIFVLGEKKVHIIQIQKEGSNGMVVMDTDNDDLREPLYGKPFGALCSPGTPLTHLKRHTHTHTATHRDTDTKTKTL